MPRLNLIPTHPRRGYVRGVPLTACSHHDLKGRLIETCLLEAGLIPYALRLCSINTLLAADNLLRLTVNNM